MNVSVNGCKVTLFPPMTTVRHALLTAGLFEELESGVKVYDEWGNEIGTEGALNEGAKIFVRSADS
ncbi:MAG: hypothetical protein M0024_07715 [Nitrospiraceae bacterium]|nr:hypothetical protein [Nitrospiraceae bacterium]